MKNVFAMWEALLKLTETYGIRGNMLWASGKGLWLYRLLPPSLPPASGHTTSLPRKEWNCSPLERTQEGRRTVRLLGKLRYSGVEAKVWHT